MILMKFLGFCGGILRILEYKLLAFDKSKKLRNIKNVKKP